MRTEHLSKLSPSTVNLHHVSGGRAEVTPEMVSAALGYARLSDLSSLYCQVKYQQIDIRGHLESKIFHDYVVKWAIKENWICTVSTIPQLCKVALDEMLSETICRKCNGTGQVFGIGKMDNCISCGGTGRKPFSKREVSRRLEMNHKHYALTWERRYCRVINLYETLEDEIRLALGRLG